MAQGIRVAKEGSTINTPDPRNVALDTRNVGSLKKLPTLFIKLVPASFSETYTRVFNVGGQSIPETYARIRIPHDFGFPPAFMGYIVFDDAFKNTAVLPYTGLALGDNLYIESNEKEVVVNGIPPNGVAASLAVTIFIENLDAATV